jgi:hypothetical protein
MQRVLKFLVATALSVAFPLQARVGEAYSDYESRVGKADSVATRGELTQYKHTIDGRIVAFTVAKGIIISEYHEKLSLDEADAMVGKLGLGPMTREPFEITNGPCWWSADRTFYAHYHRADKVLNVHHFRLRREYQDRRDANAGK